MTVDPKDDTTTTTMSSVVKKEEEKQAEEEEVEEEEEEVFLSNLTILPPLQQNGGVVEKEDCIVLPPIRPEEPVQSIRAALSEVVGYAHLTNYRLEFTPGQTPPITTTTSTTSTTTVDTTTTTTTLKKKGKKKKKATTTTSSSTNHAKNGSGASIYTGPNAVVRINSHKKIPAEGGGVVQVLDDYGDLTTLKELSSNACFQIVLERYDASTLREHIRRTRNLLQDGNVPHVTSLLSDTPTTTPTTNNNTQKDSSNTTNTTTSNSTNDAPPTNNKSNNNDSKKQSPKSEENGTKQKKSEKELLEEEQKKRRDLAEKLPKLDLDQSLSVSSSNLADFFYLACGEEEACAEFHHPTTTGSSGSGVLDVTTRLNELEKMTKISATIAYSGFHPPPPHRKLLGDLAYLEITPPNLNEPMFSITCIPNGFYVNPTTSSSSSGNFDPTPAKDPCFSHSLLDCLLQKSKSIRTSWLEALVAAKERAQLNAPLPSSTDNPLQALFRLAVRGDMTQAHHDSLDLPSSSVSASLDTVLLKPSWLVPVPRCSTSSSSENSYYRSYRHEYDLTRAEADVHATLGVDLYGGSQRDWNEEIQSAREMPTTTLPQRLERAKVLHKVLVDFGEAALAGAMAVLEGDIVPMNPNEPLRSHVYVHNNIFFSRALDSGVDTFKVTEGDKAARKAANRDANCVGTLHRLDNTYTHAGGLFTLATLLVDYMGTRLVCQSLVPGILHGEKTHKLLYGAVEATAPLVGDADDDLLQPLLEDTLGKNLMIATRTVSTFPLTEQRLQDIQQQQQQQQRPASLLPKTTTTTTTEEEKQDPNKHSTISICGPIEAKGILGSDQRKYLLDLSRLTPRDANWISSTKGGTGHWEDDDHDDDVVVVVVKHTNKKHIPTSLDDDEWTMSILRPELITHLTHKKMREWMEARKNNKQQQQQDKQDSTTETTTTTTTTDKKTDSTEKSEEESNTTTTTTTTKDGEENNNNNNNNNNNTKTESSQEEEDTTTTTSKQMEDVQKHDPEAQEYLKSLRMNVNVFLPHMKSLKDIDPAAHEQLVKDEEQCREAASFLWKEVIPNLSKEMRHNVSHQLPSDGKSLTELLHQRGINCRYLGRLATLAMEEESNDMQTGTNVASGKPEKLPRKVFPECWLELLECEMVARAAKHVLDSYFVENYGNAAIQPAQLVSSFLSAVMMTSEESAADTEHRLSSSNHHHHHHYTKENATSLDDEYYSGLTLYNVGGGGDDIPSPVRDRGQVWNDIESEIGRRFRYTLTLYNRKDTSRRTHYIPLLRRICQRCGIRLIAKNYKLGGKGLCSIPSSSVGQITESYPIAPTDVVDILPMVKNAASIAGESFVACVPGAAALVPSLHVLLPDAKATLDAAHFHFNVGSLPQALEYVQEAANLYQRVVDTPLHINVSRCLDLTAIVLFQAHELDLAATNAARALAIAVQLGGFDCPEAVAAHSTMSHIHITSGNLSEGIRHLRASIYLQELLTGRNASDLSNIYHKIGTLYHEFGGLINALRYYQEAASKRNYDRMAESMILKSMALLLANLGQFKAALDTEKRAYSIYRLTLGEEHELTKNSAITLKHFMKLAVEQGNRQVEEERKRQEELAADAVAHEIEADEAAEEERKKKKKKPKKKKGKN